MSYASTVLADSPLGYWRLGEPSGTVATDATGHGNSGTYSAVTLGSQGLVDDANTAVTFNGTTSNVSLGTLTVSGTGATIEAVFKWISGNSVIFGFEGNPFEPNSFWMRIQGGVLQVIAGDASGLGRIVATGAITSGVRYHVAGVYDGANNLLRVYLNGTQVATTASSSAIIASGAFFIGKSSVSGGFFSGTIDEVALYTTALSAARVAAHATASFTSYDNTVLADAPLLYWPLNDASGTVARDTSGNGRDGTYGLTPAVGSGAELVTGGLRSVRMTADTVTLADAAFMDQTSWTLEMWYTSTDASAGRGLACRNVLSTNRHWDIHLNEAGGGGTGHLSISGWTGSTATTFGSTGATYNDGLRHQVAASYDGTTLRLFMDGVQEGTGFAIAGLNSNVTSSIVLGSHPGGGNFTGDMAAFSYYGTTLTPTRILAHYRAGTAIILGIPPVLFDLSVYVTPPMGVTAPPILFDLSATLPAIKLRKAVSAPPILFDLSVRPPPPLPVSLTGKRVLFDLSITSPGVIIEVISPIEAPLLDASTLLSASLTLDIPVPSEVLAKPPLLQVSGTYPMPTLVNGRPDQGWGPTTLTETQYGYVTYVINHKDVTFVRGVKTRLGRVSWQEPYGEGTADFTVAGATEFDMGDVGFEWLDVEKSVEIRRYTAAGVFVRTLWTGVLMNVEWDGEQWALSAGGTFAGVASLIPLEPLVVDKERDTGLAIVMATRRRANGRWTPIKEQEFDIPTRKRGSSGETVLDYVTEMLALSQTDSGGQWTLARNMTHPRRYDLVLKDQTTEDITVYLRSHGTTVSLRKDLTQATRRIMGEGVNKNGGRWKGTIFPNIGRETVPTFNGPLNIGDSGTDVTLWQLEMSSNGYEVGTEFAIGSGHYTSVEADACTQLQEDAGLSQTGIVNLNTWNATWANGGSNMNFGSAKLIPLYEDTRVKEFFRSANGSPLSANPAYDTNVIPIGRYISYGENMSKKFARKSARLMLERDKDPGWSGTITLAGVDPPEMSKYDICEGMNVRLPWFNGSAGGILLHIAGVDWSEAETGWSVQLTVDTKARDLLTLAEMRVRNREARQDPARAAINQLRKSAQPRDTPGQWDSEGGFGELPEVLATGGEWNVYSVPAGKYGTLQRVHIETDSAKTTFCVAVFGALPGHSWLNRNVGTPLVARTDSYGPWDVPGIQDALEDRFFIEAFGGPNQASGYSPGFQTSPVTGAVTTHPVTGRLNIESGTQFVLDEAPKMFVCIWPTASCKVTGRLYLLSDE
jgi:hypothetical protein